MLFKNILCVFINTVIWVQFVSSKHINSRHHVYHGSRSHKADIKCPQPNGIFSYEPDCSKFINCGNGIPHLQSCGPGTLFNEKISACDHTWNVKCDSSMTTPPEIGVWRPLNFTVNPRTEPPEKSFGFFGKIATKFKKKIQHLSEKVKDVVGKTQKGVKTGIEENVERSFGLIGTAINKVEKKVTTGFKTYFKGGESGILCLKPDGQFPYPKDCSKFVNCWKERATLMDCAPGTLFDASTQECGWPERAICASHSLIPELKVRESVEIPFSGQLFRLRRGGAPYVGYLQVWSEGDWVPVIIKDESFDGRDQICHALGFKRGAHSETRGLVYGWSKHRLLTYKALLCGPQELDPSQCENKLLSYDDLAKSIVGIRCRRNSVSECPQNWHRWGTKCYFVDTSDKSDQTEAKNGCQHKGGRLLSLNSQEENDFVSYLLAAAGGSNRAFHTSGVTFNLQGEQYWLWQGSLLPMSKDLKYTKWWPGWISISANDTTAVKEQPRIEGSEPECIILRDFYPLEDSWNEIHTAKYFFWMLSNCKEKLPFICERDPLEIGCIVGRGETYHGLANITASGKPCLTWQSVRTIIPQGMTIKKKLNGNYCSNPDGDDLPWCFIDGGTTEFCDIPRCPYKEPLRVEGASHCDPGKYRCRTGLCIHLEFVCDGLEDCPNGDEEDGCPDYTDIFEKHSGYRLNGSEVEKWLYTPKPTCSIRCVQAKNFVCYSYNYEESTSTCVLSKSNAGLVGGLTRDFMWEYHERIDLATDCSFSFICLDFKCISKDKICDGRRDCAGGEDENDCVDISTLEIRLANGTGPHEGRVEIQVAGVWGEVCDDMWGLEDSHVVCKQLGYHKGARSFYTNSHFGNGKGSYLMDDLNCRGDEQNLAHCNFGGWGKNDCDFGESAGVTCYRDNEVCSPNEWTCDNGRCIDFSFYCDQINDCGDNSDEKPDLCMSPIEVRLIQDDAAGKSLDPVLKKPSEGRVELRYRGLWGTVCDDDVTVNEGHVLCRMLGWAGSVAVYKNNSFGVGAGPIWLDGLRCLGNELSVDTCHHERWGSTNCDHNEDLGVKCTAKVLKAEKNDTWSSESSSAGPIFEVLPSKCGIRYVNDNPKEILASPRIVDGYIPRRGAQPWMAGIRRRTSLGSIHECGAFILSNDLILSAAHCLWKYTISEYLVRTGDYNNEEKDAYEEEWLIDNMIVHPLFDKGALFNNDLGIIKIKRKNGRGIQFNERVQPICLTSKDFDYPAGLNCTVAGWGTRSATSGFSRILQSTLLPILSDSVCKADYVYGSTRISQGMFCAGYMEGGVDTCQGDSGGPLICLVNERYTAVGITSWGHGCARANKPGVYTKLSEYVDWIYNVTREIEVT